MKNLNRRDVSRILRLTAAMAAASATIALMQGPAAAASDYCVGKGVEGAKSCVSDLTPKGGGLAAVMAAKITDKDKERCERIGHDARDTCESKSLRVTDQGNARCDADYCWAIVKTVGAPSLCAKVPRSRLGGDRLAEGRLKLVDYVLEGDKEALKTEACPDEMLDVAARDEGLEMLPVEKTAGWSCLIGGDYDRPRWVDGYCYGIFRMGDRLVCGRAREDRVAPVRMGGALDRRYLITASFGDCPRSVLESYNRWKGDRDMGETMGSFDGKLPPAPTGAPRKRDSTITGLPDDDPPPDVDRVNVDIDIDIGVDRTRGGRIYGGREHGEHGRPGARPSHGEPTKSGHPPSTITGPGAPPPPVTHRPPPPPFKPAPVAGPGPVPRPVPAPIAGPGPVAGPGPRGVKIDVAPTGHSADLSDVRGKVLNIAPKDD